MFNFSKAIDLVKNGEFVMRKCWKHKLLVFDKINNKILINFKGTAFCNYSADSDDIFAEDWVKL